MNKILIACMIIAGVFVIRHHSPAALGHRLTPTKSAPAAYVEPPVDTRSAIEWEDDCDPAQAIQTASGVITFWCRTPYNNDFDRGQALPSDWRWL